jgi:ubiquinone/menaquinone biosynthesis C-methylase UbiE
MDPAVEAKVGLYAKMRGAVGKLLTGAGLRTDPYVVAAAKAGYQDVNDFLEAGADNMARTAMAQLFSHDIVGLRSGKLLEVGARTGRYTREIVKYVPAAVQIVALESLPVSCFGLAKYAARWPNVTVVQGDVFANGFEAGSFDRVLIPWFDMTMSLYRWSRLLREAARLLKPGGLVAFDFMDSQDRLLEVVEVESNAPYFLVNGGDLEALGRHVGLSKVLEFGVRFNEQIAKYHVYRKG